MEWIKAKDGLPDNDELCIVVNKRGDIDIALFCKGKFLCTDENGYQFEAKYTTYWMPIPEPPK